MQTISVIVPTFNYAHYLDECLQSILNQSVKPNEIIVVDDESSDNTKEVCEEYPVKYIWQKNKGLAGARNTGIREAASQFIMCLDADDMLRPDAIKEHLAIADENSIAQCGLMYFGNQVANIRPQKADLNSLLHTNTVFCNSVYPKKAWEGVEYDESEIMRLGLEDWLFWIELAIKGYKIRISDYISLLYRRHGDTMTHQKTHPNWNTIVDYMAQKIKSKYGVVTHFNRL